MFVPLLDSLRRGRANPMVIGVMSFATTIAVIAAQPGVALA